MKDDKDWKFKDNVHYVGIEYGLTMPTGDEDKGLGVGDPTAYVGARAHFGLNGKAPKQDQFVSAIEPGLGYFWHSGNSDMSGVLADINAMWAYSDTGAVIADVSWFFETGDGTMSRDELSVVDAFLGVAHFAGEHNQILWTAGVGTQVNEGGLETEWMFEGSVTYRFDK